MAKIAIERVSWGGDKKKFRNHDECPRLDVVLLGYSVVSGVGFGLMYIPSVVGAAPFFNKRRSLAMGKLAFVIMFNLL